MNRFGIDPCGYCLDGMVEQWLRGRTPTAEQVRLINQAIAEWVEADPNGGSAGAELRLDARVNEILVTK